MSGKIGTTRACILIAGQDRLEFLQGIVTNDVYRARNSLVYAAMLTPQGKFLADMFIHADAESVLLDVNSGSADSLVNRMNLYRLRSDVHIDRIECNVLAGLGQRPPDSFRDPRHAALGWRRYCRHEQVANDIDWTGLRVRHCIPETFVELLPNDTYILEAGFERLNGVDFGKGCYVGQEVTARMKHKARLRKGLVTVGIDSEVPLGTTITADGRIAGTVFTQSGGQAIAMLRHDRVGKAELKAGDASITMLGHA